MAHLGKVLTDRVRSLLHIRKARTSPQRGPKPRLGGAIVCGDVKMIVQSGLTDDLWRWLQDQGWREPAFRPDRRRYREVQPSWVTQLFDCAPDERVPVLSSAIARATQRRTLNGINVPSTLSRR